LVAARLETVQEALEIRFQIFLVVRRRLTIHPRGTIFTRPAVGFAQQVHIDVVSQAQEGPIRIFPRQLCYPLKSR
jgi:hypothetical protein